MNKTFTDAYFHLREAFFFALIGLLATLTHYVVAIVLVEQVSAGVYVANVVAYGVAVSVSLFGHSKITFKKNITKSRAVRFVIVSVSALLLSQLLLFGLRQVGTLGYRIEFLVVVFFIPLYSYLLNKFWVYKH